MANKRKRNNTQAAAVKKHNPSAGIPSPPSDAAIPFEPASASSVVLPEDIEIAVETLQTLAQYPSVIKSKACRDLRTAVYGFRQACTTGLNAASEGNNLTARISGALTDGKNIEALILLSEMRIRQETPTLGALCRWVRTLDVVSGLSDPIEEISKPAGARSSKNLELLRVLDSILRVTGPTDTNPASVFGNSDPIALQTVWDLRDGKLPVRQTRASVLDKSIFSGCSPDLKRRFRVIETTAGPARKPPNLHPAVLFASTDDTILLEEGATRPECYNHPVVPNLRVIKDVLSAEECSSIIAAGESMEFIPDAPLRPEGEESSVLAHNFYWIVDQAFHDRLWDRVRSFVPERVAGKQVRGINRRFRVYRYVPGAEYRCHIDGAWPPSGIHPTTDAYQYDASPPAARQSSLFTFLIYLNDEFKGGETTFFIPGVREGVMNAYPVKPLQGSVAVFPHGEAQGALLHEGTGVIEGAKYVIRTDVEYDVDATAAD